MELWRRVWREGLAPQLSFAGLAALRRALQDDDRRLLQRATTAPPPLQCVGDRIIEGACALGFCGWKGDGLATVAAVASFCARTCQGANERLGEAGLVRFFLDWFDATPRLEMRRELLAEVGRSWLVGSSLAGPPDGMTE